MICRLIPSFIQDYARQQQQPNWPHQPKQKKKKRIALIYSVFRHTTKSTNVRLPLFHISIILVVFKGQHNTL
jgi:hypothetical protein